MRKPNWWFRSERKCEMAPREKELVLPLVQSSLINLDDRFVLADVMDDAYPNLAARLRAAPTAKALLNCLRLAGGVAASAFYGAHHAIWGYGELTSTARRCGFGAVEISDLDDIMGLVSEREEHAFERDRNGRPIYPPARLLQWTCQSPLHCARLAWSALDGLEVPADINGGIGLLRRRVEGIVMGWQR